MDNIRAYNSRSSKNIKKNYFSYGWLNSCCGLLHTYFVEGTKFNLFYHCILATPRYLETMETNHLQTCLLEAHVEIMNKFKRWNWMVLKPIIVSLECELIKHGSFHTF